MLTDRITLTTTDTEPEDYLYTSLGVIFPDDITNQHGDPATPVTYTSPRFGDLHLSLADPQGEDNRRLFSHHLWNAGVLSAVLIEEAYEAALARNGEAEDGRRVTGGVGKGDAEDQDTIDKEESDASKKGTTEEEDNSPDTTPYLHALLRLHDKTVLELGAGTGLAAIIAAKAGAREVLITDYPAPEILSNLRANVERNVAKQVREGRCQVMGHAWGDVPSAAARVETGSAEEQKGDREEDDGDGHADAAVDVDAQAAFPPVHHHALDLVLAADTLWLPSAHSALHDSIAYFLRRRPAAAPTTGKTTPGAATTGGRALIVAGFHTGRAKVAEFFDAEALSARGLEVERIWEVDAEGRERGWVVDRGGEDVSGRKRWCVVGVLRRVEERGWGGKGERGSYGVHGERVIRK